MFLCLECQPHSLSPSPAFTPTANLSQKAMGALLCPPTVTEATMQLPRLCLALFIDRGLPALQPGIERLLVFVN